MLFLCTKAQLKGVFCFYEGVWGYHSVTGNLFLKPVLTALVGVFQLGREVYGVSTGVLGCDDTIQRPDRNVFAYT